MAADRASRSAVAGRAPRPPGRGGAGGPAPRGHCRDPQGQTRVGGRIGIDRQDDLAVVGRDTVGQRHQHRAGPGPTAPVGAGRPTDGTGEQRVDPSPDHVGDQGDGPGGARHGAEQLGAPGHAEGGGDVGLVVQAQPVPGAPGHRV